MSGEDCHQYAICTSGKLSVHMCPTGMAFSPSVYACMPEKEVDCEEARLTPESLFELAGLGEWFDVLCASYPTQIFGYFSDKRQSCRHFYRCENGYRNDFQCPSNLIFDERIGSCLPPSSYTCPRIQETNRTPPKVARQIKFFRFHEQKRDDIDEGARELQEGGDDHMDSVRQVKFATERNVEQRQVKFKRVNQLLQQLSDLVQSD